MMAEDIEAPGEYCLFCGLPFRTCFHPVNLGSRIVAEPAAAPSVPPRPRAAKPDADAG